MPAGCLQPPTIAARLFDSTFAQSELEDKLDSAGILYEELRWDYYDESLELDEVPNDYCLTPEAQIVIHEAGFSTVYVNHINKWETHYNFGSNRVPPVKGWRVSYPHKRGEKGGSIWVEEVPENWPASSLESGYVIVKNQ